MQFNIVFIFKISGINGKPLSKNEKEIEPKLDKVLSVVEKDSEVQPPNPLPPESASKEKHDAAIKPVDSKVEDKKIEIKLQPIEPVADKSIEGHPKNLKLKLNEVKTNGEVIENKVVEKPPKEEEKAKISTIQEKTQEKIDIMKQQKLIETIKQHGEEQKELMKEQKEILDEIIKTKNELQQNKIDKPVVDSVEANKIAVESIQKIANMAIQSLSGVTDKAAVDQAGNKESEPLQKIANDAVQEIAKKAVESIVAIKEINEKPKQNLEAKENKAELPNNLNQLPSQYLPNQNDQVQQNGQNSGPNANIDNNIPVAQSLINSQTLVQNQNNVAKNNNVAGNQVNIEPAKENHMNIIQDRQSSNIADHADQVLAEPIQANNAQSVNVQAPNIIQKPENIKPANAETAQDIVNNQAANVVQEPPNEQSVKTVIEPVQNEKHMNAGNQQPNENVQQINVAPPPVYNQNENVVNQQAVIPPLANVQVNNKQSDNIVASGVPKQGVKYNEAAENQNQEKQPPHSHSPDEPQSYKVGEDSHLKSTMQKNIADNVPLPIAIKAQILNKPKRDILQAEEENVHGAKYAFDIVNPTNRLKREVVDCTETLQLQPEDKEICKTLVTDHKIEKRSEEILPSKFDLSDALERKNFDAIHHIRSLKSYDET